MAATPPLLVPVRKTLDVLLADFITHRMSLWLWISVAIAAAIFFLARHMLGVALFKLGLITIASYVGYWVSRALESQRPTDLLDQAAALRAGPGPTPANPLGDNPPSPQDLERAWQLEQLAANVCMRRGWIVAACLIASAMGG